MVFHREYLQQRTRLRTRTHQPFVRACCSYVDKSVAKAGTALKVNVRGKINDAAVTKMPFVPTHYHKPAQ